MRSETYQSDEYKFLEAKINDQYRFAISKNKIMNTDFLNQTEKLIAEKFLRKNSISNFVFFGGNGEDSERNILLFFPEKFSQDIVAKNYDKILCGIKISLPKNCYFEHRVYLSGMMKLGVKREKIGDIIVHDDGAEMIVLKEVAEFLKTNLQELTRFKSAKIEVISVLDVQHKPKELEEEKVIVSSMRLDSFVASLAKTSRTKALEMIAEQRVFVNHQLVEKGAKKIVPNDQITIRGKGKFIVGELQHQTRSERLLVMIKKYK